MSGRQAATVEVNGFIQGAMSTLPVYVLAIGATLFTSVMAPGGFMSEVGVSLRIAANVVNLTVYWLATYFCLAPFIVWGLSRRIPVFFSQTTFYLPLAVIGAALYYRIVDAPVSALNVAFGVACIMTVVSLTVLIGLLLFRTDAELLLSKIGFAGYLFSTPSRPNRSTAQAAWHDDIEGPILKMKAANQYINVTTQTGQKFVRVSLKAAIKQMPSSSGLKIHRSTWISWAHVQSVQRRAGRWEVTDRNSEVELVSRTHAEAFDREMKRRQIENTAILAD